MGATPTHRAMGSRGYRGPGLWILASLVLIGALVQGCTDNEGPAGPNFAQQGGPVPVTGFADTKLGIAINITANPNAIQFGQQSRIVVIVTNINGKPLPGKTVLVSTDKGALSTSSGVTGADGTFVTFLTLNQSNFPGEFPGATSGSAIVSAFVDGVGPATVEVFASTIAHPVPEKLQIVPADLPLSIGADTDASLPVGFDTCSVFAATVQFTIAGGSPPYTSITTTGVWLGSSVDATGKFTGPDIGPQAVGTAITDFITVTDSAGAIATAKLTATCTAPVAP